MGLTQSERLERLNEISIRQMKTLTTEGAHKALEDGTESDEK